MQAVYRQFGTFIRKCHVGVYMKSTMRLKKNNKFQDKRRAEDSLQEGFPYFDDYTWNKKNVLLQS